MITEADKRILIAQDDHTLAEWCCTLNSFGWPAELPNPDPPEYHVGSRRGKIIDWISGMVGERLILRVWNKDRMTDAEFEDFWAATVLKDPDAKVRYKKSLEEYGMMMVRFYSDEFDAPLV